MGNKTPILVEVKPRYDSEPIEKLIRRFSKKVKKERIIEDWIERKRYTKPSVSRRKERRRRQKVLEKLHKEKQVSND
jgi:ribosomal protein S21